MTSKRQEAERQFQRLSRQEKDERTTSKSRSITDADKTTRDLKTADLKKLREAREAETGLKKGRSDQTCHAIQEQNHEFTSYRQCLTIRDAVRAGHIKPIE